MMIFPQPRPTSELRHATATGIPVVATREMLPVVPDERRLRPIVAVMYVTWTVGLLVYCVQPIARAFEFALALLRVIAG